MTTPLAAAPPRADPGVAGTRASSGRGPSRGGMTPCVVAVLMHLGTLGVVLGLGKVHARFVGGYDFSGSSRFAWALAYVGLLALSSYATGLPDAVRSGSILLRALGAVAVGTFGISLAQLLLGSALLPRFVTVLGPFLLVPGYVASGWLARCRPPGSSAVVAVLGADEAAGLRGDLGRVGHRRYHLSAVLSTADASAGLLLESAENQRAAMVVLGADATSDPRIVHQAAALHARGVRIRTLDLFYDQALGRLPSRHVGQVSLLFDIGELHRVAYERLKRVLDALVGLAGLCLLTVLTPLVAVGNLAANRGPLLYRQPRVGRDGRVFEMIKFRTMEPGSDPGSWTVDGDGRVTPFGRWLRRTHLDELPQMVNILRGELATVGPRPERPHHVEALRARIPFYDVRHLVRPGLTGWAQVNRPYASTLEEVVEKLGYDLYYLRHQSLLLDLRILLRTTRDVAGGTGR